MDQKIIDLYDGLTHGYMSRREFIDKAAQIVGSTAAAAAFTTPSPGEPVIP